MYLAQTNQQSTTTRLAPQPKQTVSTSTPSGNGGVAISACQGAPAMQFKQAVGHQAGISGGAMASQDHRTGLPNRLKAGIEQLSGYSMDDVRVHYNSVQPAQYQAHAFAFGNQIHLAPGQERHLPHEAWHVVQQKQGRVKPMLQMKGKTAVNNDNGLEREADEMGARALQMSHQTTSAHRQVNLVTTRGPAVVQRKGETPKSYDLLLRHPRYSRSWFTVAGAYERRLGAYSARHPRANAALNAAINRMEQVVSARYSNELNRPELMKEVFFRDEPESSGQVGIELDYKEMLKVLHQGNLRERMTAFYNAAYYGAGYGNDLRRGFKAILHEIIFDRQDSLIDSLGLKAKELARQNNFYRNFLNIGALRPVVRSLLRAIGSVGFADMSYTFDRDVFALGNLSMQAADSGVAVSQWSRQNRQGNVVEPYTPRAMEELGVPLSNTELKYTFQGVDTRRNIGDYLPFKRQTDIRRERTRDLALPWQSGKSRFEISPDSRWYKKVHDQLRMPVIAGVSGTTTRMLKAYQFLNAQPQAVDFRLALMGWMLPTEDHSLYEILRGAQLAGVTGPGEQKSLTDPIAMYMNIAPLTTQELRTQVGHENMFPHEEVYWNLASRDLPNNQPVHNRDTNEWIDPPAGPHLPRFRTTERFASHYRRTYDRAQRDDGQGRRVSFNRAFGTALGVYSGGMHRLINTVMEMKHRYAPGAVIKWRLRQIINRMVALRGAGQAVEFPEELNCLNVQHNYLNTMTNATQRTKATNRITREVANFVEEIYPELLLQASMAKDALDNLPSSEEMVYRGEAEGPVNGGYIPWGGYRQKEYTFNSFVSFSRNRNLALQFAETAIETGAGTTRVLLELQLRGHKGKDISDFSLQRAEEEVLLMPGARIRVTGSREQRFTYQNRRRVEVTETVKVYTAEEVQ
ncbi:DUF4157 domain-containing protein [Gynuella sunshinyii]|uniref:eCIS core domain-containing protein n=1 Tax=Gynuella sunshinyii YC6258 TaxID=1445510 RepID=A0A0C5V181_9GAMM|nr:DUF4157 domain-containing protein [Gynuella sunshinyii]AJQ93240.1 hypothetical Protein YC6258_01192 [Gynuella sunshinyii YC6258]